MGIALQDSYVLLQQEIELQNADLIDLNQLLREAEATRVLYETFLARLKETSVLVGLLRADSRVLSEAVRGEQVSPRKGLILAGAFIIGASLGLGIILLQELRQETFRTSAAIEQQTGHRAIAQIPMLPVRRRDRLVRYIADNPISAASEAMYRPSEILLMLQGGT